MIITSVKVHKTEKEGSAMKASASVVLDDCFIIRDLKIIEGKERLFLSMPRRKLPDGTFRDIVNPLNAETRELFENTILEEYKKL